MNQQTPTPNPTPSHHGPYAGRIASLVVRANQAAHRAGHPYDSPMSQLVGAAQAALAHADYAQAQVWAQDVLAGIPPAVLASLGLAPDQAVAA